MNGNGLALTHPASIQKKTRACHHSLLPLLRITRKGGGINPATCIQLQATSRMERYICIHAHFYQPPRENPWLETVEVQDSAYPYHDWNQRIASECYAPNAAARILDGEGCIAAITNNYAKISFNFGPTLQSICRAWM